MKKRKPVAVVTYGSFDLLHHGHVRILQRLRKLADYLVVYVSDDEFHKVVKGKELVEDQWVRQAKVQELLIANQVSFERSWDQRITDIARLQSKGYEVVFSVGVDWVGKFDYLEGMGCTVIYLPRTPGVSSTEKRKEHKKELKPKGKVKRVFDYRRGDD